jgi:nucleotide-binding universal stress UspA family protein
MCKVYVPLDGSTLSKQAVNVGEMLTRACGGSLHLIHILEESRSPESLPPRAIADRQVAERYLNGLVAKLPDDIEAHVSIIRGNATEELLRISREHSDAIITMSTHGRGGLGRIMFGSVADKVLRGASAPVALVRNNGQETSTRLRTVLVPLDGSPLAEEALPLAEQLARTTDATISHVRVIETFWDSTLLVDVPEAAYLTPEQVNEYEAQALADARSYLNDVATDLRAKGLRVVWEVRIGRPADEITRVAETTTADLILISTHGRGGLRRWALGSVTNELLHHGTTPILAIPPQKRSRDSDRQDVDTLAATG